MIKKIGIAIVVIFVLSVIINEAIIEPRRKADIDYNLKKIVSELNNLLPYAIDEETRADSVECSESQTILYYMTLVSMTKETFDTTKFKNERFWDMVEQFRSGEGLKPLTENSVTIIARYYDRNGRFLLQLVIGPNDYGPRAEIKLMDATKKLKPNF